MDEQIRFDIMVDYVLFVCCWWLFSFFCFSFSRLFVVTGVRVFSRICVLFCFRVLLRDVGWAEMGVESSHALPNENCVLMCLGGWVL